MDRIRHILQKNALLKSLFFFHESSFRFEITPYRDWFVLVSLLACVILVFVAVAAYSFIAITTSGRPETAASVDGVALQLVDEEKLDSVILLLEKRDDAFEAIKQSPPPIIDPSL